MPLVVLQIVRPAEGGMRTQVRTLIDGMQDVRNVVAAPKSVLRSLGRTEPNGTFDLPPKLSPASLLLKGFRLGQWARTRGVHIVSGHGIRWTPLFAAAARSAGVPLVVTLHNLIPSSLSGISRSVLRTSLNSASRIIAVSEAVAASAERALGKSIAARVRVVYNGIDLAPFAKDAIPTREAARAALGISRDCRVALCVARLSPEKNVSLFVDAAAQIAASGDNLDLLFLIAGDGREREALTERIRINNLEGIATLLGEREDIPSLLSAANVVCVPSREEGLGLAAIEAMAAGRAVVATRAGGLPEVVIDGETGKLIEPDAAPRELAAALNLFLTDTRYADECGVFARKRALSLFSSERMIAETRALYAEVLSA